METLSKEISRRNFYAFIWHASLLAVAKNFMDVDTVIPSMLINAGGTQLHVGILTAIMIGGSSFTQLLFAPTVSGASRKKPLLLGGISLRILSLAGTGFLFLGIQSFGPSMLIVFIFIIISIFSISGAFANLPFTDILGKSILEDQRKRFFSLRQIISSAGIFASAFLVREILSRQSYPDNYARVFFLAAGFLFMASLGFWMLKEYIPKDHTPVKQSFKDVWRELKHNRRLQYFLISINTLGLGIGILPFVLLYSGAHRELSSQFIGNLLIAKTLGLILAGLWLFSRGKKVRYHRMMETMVVLGLFAVAFAWGFPGLGFSYLLSFFAGGLFLSLYQIISSGVLLEISSLQNRSLYTAIAGAGSILPVLFPLFGGALIGWIGFHVFFALYACFMAISVIFIHRLNCQK